MSLLGVHFPLKDNARFSSEDNRCLILFINSNFVILILILLIIKYIYNNLLDLNNANISIFQYNFNLVRFVLFKLIFKIK